MNDVSLGRNCVSCLAISPSNMFMNVMSSQMPGSHLSSPIQNRCLPKDFARRLTLEPSVGTSWGFKKNLAPTVPDVNEGIGSFRARLVQVPGTPCFGKPGFNMFQSGSAQVADLGTGFGEFPVLRTKFWKPGLGTFGSGLGCEEPSFWWFRGRGLSETSGPGHPARTP